MIAGGADPFAPFSFGGFRSLKALDNESCKPYSESHGINLGEGAAFFLLEDYEGAKARNANILAEIIGYGLSADAYHQTAPDIGGNGAVRAIELAMKQGGIEKDDVCYLNGHGTGTGANDKMEDLAYMKVFKDYVGKIPMSSIKGSVGHCLGAAGAVECAASLMAVQNDKVPPTIHFDKPEKNSINHVPNKAQDHVCNVVLSNSFAFGGNNCCIALAKPDMGYQGTPYEKKNIVITGIGCNGVGGANVEELFETFDKQKICIGDITEYNTDNYKCKRAGIMPEVDFGKYMPAKILRRVDPITKLAITSGKQALEDSGLSHVDLFASGSVGNAKTDDCEINAVKDIFTADTYMSNAQTLIGSTSGCVGMYGMLNSIYSFEKGKVLSMPVDAKGEIRDDIKMKYQKGENQTAKIETACVDAISYGGGYASVILEKY